MTLRRALLPLSILLLGGCLSVPLLAGRPAPEAEPAEARPVPVRVLSVAPETLQLRVRSQGTVAPRTESELVARVPGQVERIGEGLEPGAFFREGDLLVQLDARDLELAAKRARAALERARAEEEYASAALDRQRALRAGGIASDAMVDEMQRAARSARARRLEAEVDVERAARDLARTRITAPFDGRTRDRRVDVGRFVSVGTPLARIYAVDFAEIALPIPDAELAYLDLSLGQAVEPEAAPRVELGVRFAGREHRWEGRIVRTEAEIDPRTRMVNAVVRVADPYRGDADTARIPLAAGLFVEAEILGRRVAGVFRVPRSALADGESLWVVDDADRLTRRQVEVLRLERDTALVSAGLEDAPRVSLMEPRLAREGLAVRPVRVESLAGRLPREEPAS